LTDTNPKAMSETTTKTDSEIIADLHADQPLAAPYQPIDYDAIGAEYLANARRLACRERWEAACPPALRESDWQHPRLVPYAGQIAAILGHSPAQKGLLASGPTGRGKSRAMWALMHRLACEEGRDIRYYHAVEFFAALQSRISYGQDDANGWIEAVARVPIVFIDDLGQQSLLRSREDWAQGWFFRFLDIRVGERLPLYITTNLRAEDMVPTDARANLRGDPLLRRLLDLCDPVKF
jgi:hypothetical protein